MMFSLTYVREYDGMPFNRLSQCNFVIELFDTHHEWRLDIIVTIKYMINIAIYGTSDINHVVSNASIKWDCFYLCNFMITFENRFISFIHIVMKAYWKRWLCRVWRHRFTTAVTAAQPSVGSGLALSRAVRRPLCPPPSPLSQSLSHLAFFVCAASSVAAIKCVCSCVFVWYVFYVICISVVRVVLYVCWLYIYECSECVYMYGCAFVSVISSVVYVRV